MEIGSSGITAPAISMGTWAIGGGEWWGDNDDSDSVRAIRCALDHGVTWIDTAPVYGLGHSEEVVGKALKGRRGQVILSTKCGLHWDGTEGTYHKSVDGHDIYRDLSAQGIRRGLESSLKRLQTDYVDILYTHWQSVGPDKVPIEETMNELMKMKREGKIRAIGASNVNVLHLEEYLKYGQVDIIQEKYSMLDRAIETLLLPFCEYYRISVQAYSPLEQGLLAGKITMETKLSPGDVRNKNNWWKPENRIRVLNMLNGWKDLTRKYDCPVGNLAICWTAMRNKRMNVLVGARKEAQVLENVNAANIRLEEDDYKRMTKDLDALLAHRTGTAGRP